MCSVRGCGSLPDMTLLNPGGRIFLNVCEGRGKNIERSLKTIAGEGYDRSFIGHVPDDLIRVTGPMFSFDCEVGYDGTAWHNYIFHAM